MVNESHEVGIVIAPLAVNTTLRNIYDSWLQQHRSRFFDEGFEGLQEARARCAVDDAVIARHGHRHDRGGNDLAGFGDRALFAGTDGENGALRRVYAGL